MPSRYPVQTVTAQAKNRIRIAPGRARRKAIDRFTLDGDPDRRDAFLNQIKGRPLAIVRITPFPVNLAAPRALGWGAFRIKGGSFMGGSLVPLWPVSRRVNRAGNEGDAKLIEAIH